MSARVVAVLAGLAGLALVAGTAAASGYAVQAASEAQATDEPRPSLVDLYAEAAPTASADPAADAPARDPVAAGAHAADADAGDAARVDGPSAGTAAGGAGDGGPVSAGGAAPLGDTEWRPADLAEVRRAVAAVRSAAGLPALVTPFGSCIDRGFVGTGTSFGIPKNQTHGQNLVAAFGSVLRGVPKSGGVMALQLSTVDVTDRSATVRRAQNVVGSMYECGIPAPTAPGDTTVFDPPPSPPPPSSPPPPPPPAPSPSPSADPAEPGSGE